MNATGIRFFRIIRYGSGWTATGPTPDVVLSKHYTESGALNAFRKVKGPATLEERQPDGTFKSVDSKVA